MGWGGQSRHLNNKSTRWGAEEEEEKGSSALLFSLSLMHQEVVRRNLEKISNVRKGCFSFCKRVREEAAEFGGFSSEVLRYRREPQTF